MVTRSGLVSCLPTYGCVQYVGGNWCLFYICDEKSSPICADISPYNSCIVVNTLSRLSTHCRRIFRHGNWIELPRPGENVLSLYVPLLFHSCEIEWHLLDGRCGWRPKRWAFSWEFRLIVASFNTHFFRLFGHKLFFLHLYWAILSKLLSLYEK